MAKWVVELTEFDISYVPRPSMKAQVLADFVIECTPIDDVQVEGQPQEETLEPAWILHVDGASNAKDVTWASFKLTSTGW